MKFEKHKMFKLKSVGVSTHSNVDHINTNGCYEFSFIFYPQKYVLNINDMTSWQHNVISSLIDQIYETCIYFDMNLDI